MLVWVIDMIYRKMLSLHLNHSRLGYLMMQRVSGTHQFHIQLTERITFGMKNMCPGLFTIHHNK